MEMICELQQFGVQIRIRVKLWRRHCEGDWERGKTDWITRLKPMKRRLYTITP